MDSELKFRRSSRCNEGAGCVAVAMTADRVYLRDDKEVGGSVLSVSPESWRNFVEAAKAGEFD